MLPMQTSKTRTIRQVSYKPLKKETANVQTQIQLLQMYKLRNNTSDNENKRKTKHEHKPTYRIAEELIFTNCLPENARERVEEKTLLHARKHYEKTLICCETCPLAISMNRKDLKETLIKEGYKPKHIIQILELKREIQPVRKDKRPIKEEIHSEDR